MKKRKTFKKFFGLLLTMALLLTMVIPAFADDGGTLLAAPTLGSTDPIMKPGTDISVYLNKGTAEWANAVTSVKIGGTVLSPSEYTVTSSKITFIRTDTDKIFTKANAKSIEGRLSQYDLTISADGYNDFTGVITLKDYGAKTFQIRVVDGAGKIYPIKTYTWDQLESMKQSGDVYYNTICSMAGLRTFKAEGVLLTDILNDAGVTFGPGMKLQLRTNDFAASENDSTTDNAYYNRGLFTYENLMGMTRYYFPSIYTDADMKSTLLGTGNFSDLARTTLAADPNKTAVTPMIGLRYIETVYRNDSESPANTPYSSLLSDEKAFRFLYGLALDDTGTMVYDETTTWSATYCAFGIDIIDPDYIPPYSYSDETTGVSISAGSGVLEEGTTANIQLIGQGANYENAKAALGDTIQNFMLYDISLNGVTGTLSGKVKVSIPIPEGYDRDNLAVYWIDEDGQAVKMTGTVEGDYYIFETDHFSLYALAEVKAAAVAADVSANPVVSNSPTNAAVTGTTQTGDSASITPYLAAIIGAAVVIILIVVYRIRKNLLAKKEG